MSGLVLELCFTLALRKPVLVLYFSPFGSGWLADFPFLPPGDTQIIHTEDRNSHTTTFPKVPYCKPWRLNGFKDCLRLVPDATRQETPFSSESVRLVAAMCPQILVGFLRLANGAALAGSLLS